jgi:hypothetical protein
VVKLMIFSWWLTRWLLTLSHSRGSPSGLISRRMLAPSPHFTMDTSLSCNNIEIWLVRYFRLDILSNILDRIFTSYIEPKYKSLGQRRLCFYLSSESFVLIFTLTYTYLEILYPFKLLSRAAV